MSDEAVELWPCNDCGALIPTSDDLCNSCYQEQLEAEQWELLHPEVRCPPRE